jgi:thymidylate synthase (FAD)
MTTKVKPIEQSAVILSNTENLMSIISNAGRTCYQTTPSDDIDVNRKFIKQLITRGHESVLEHGHIMVELITDRAVMAELTRHRLASFSIESQRYCNYDKCLTVIKPDITDGIEEWKQAMIAAHGFYNSLLSKGVRKEIARLVLPNSTAVKITMTANIREWRHILKLRTTKYAYPPMRSLMYGILKQLCNDPNLLVFFEDILEDLYPYSY